MTFCFHLISPMLFPQSSKRHLFFNFNQILHCVRITVWSSITTVQLSKSRKLILIQYNYLVHSLYSHFTQGPSNILSQLRVSSQCRIQSHITFCYASLVCFNLKQFLGLLCFSATLFMKKVSQFFRRRPLHFGLSDISPLFDSGYTFWGQENHRGDMVFSVQYFQEHMILVFPFQVILMLILYGCLPSFFTINKVTVFPLYLLCK